MIETLTALAPLAISAAVIVFCIAFIIAVAAAVFGALSVELGSEKIKFKLAKQPKTLATPLQASSAEQATVQLQAPADNVVAIAHEPIPQEPQMEDIEKDEAESRDREAFMNYYFAKNLSELDAAYDAFMLGIPSEHFEFWHTEHLQRREALGADRARDAVRDLTGQQPTWAYPHAILLNWALEDHDLVEARRHLDAGLTKTQSPQFGHVLSAGVKLTFKTDGKDAALALACQWSKADQPESIRASAFVTLADLLKEAGDADGQRVALEFASSLQPSNEARSFSLGYSYAESNNQWAPAIWHYQRCIGQGGDGPNARNNLGIVYALIDKAVAVQTYEQASRDGEKFSAANIAHLLIEDGYVSIAQALLDAVDDVGEAAENHASARKAALTC